MLDDTSSPHWRLACHLFLVLCCHGQVAEWADLDGAKVALVEGGRGHPGRVQGLLAVGQAILEGKIQDDSSFCSLGSVDNKLEIAFPFRVAHLLANLGWVDLYLGSSPGWWPLL